MGLNSSGFDLWSWFNCMRGGFNVSLFQEDAETTGTSDPNTSSNESDDVSTKILGDNRSITHHLKGERREGHSLLTDNALLRARLNEQV